MTDAPALAPRPVRRRLVAFAALALLLALALSWWWFGRPAAAPPLPPPPSPTAVAVPAEPATAGNPLQQLQSSQLADLERVNNVLRQQVLALTERVRVIGEQLAAQRLELLSTGTRVDPSEATSLALAEQWLELAQARFDLFDDARGALLALDATDRALISSTDPRVLSLRQTLAIEREALRALPWLDTVSLAGQFQAWQDGLREWPERLVQAGSGSTRNAWAARLDRYFRVRKLETSLSEHPDARRDEIAAELAWARILLVRGENAALRQALERVQETIRNDFATDDAAVSAALIGLDRVIRSLGRVDPAPRLGATLLELRGFNGAAEVLPAVPELPAATPMPEVAPAPAEATPEPQFTPEVQPDSAEPTPADTPETSVPPAGEPT